MKHLLSLLIVLLLGACGFLSQRAAPAPFCGAMDGASLGSIQLDYSAPVGTPQVSSGEAEAAARKIAGIADSVTTCSVRFAHYRNLGVDIERVWVVHFDGLSWSALGGPVSRDGRAAASPPILRRALFVVTADAPASVLISVAAGP